MILLRIVILLVMWNYVSAMIGYDCGASTLNVTTISLLDIDNCDIPEEEGTVSRTNIYLLQVNQFTHTETIQCKIEISRTVQHCGMFSHASVVDNAHMEYIHTISKETCQVALRHGTMRIMNTILDGLQPNITTVRSITLAGKATNSGECFGAQYSDPFGSWENVVVMGIVRISLRSMSARVKIENNKVYLPSGLSYPLKDGHCVDPEGGYTYWESLPSTPWCRGFVFSFLYQSLAFKTISSSGIFYTVAMRDVSFTLTQKGVEESCGLTMFKTEHPKLFIVESNNSNILTENNAVKIEADNMDIFMYINAKFLYTERYIRSQMKTLYRDVLHHQCNLEREVLRNSLAIAPVMPDEFAFRFMKGPGYMAVLAGEVIHIIQCVPVEVKIRQTEECYNQLSITRGNETAFLTPRTHIIVNQATQIPCNSPLQQYYRLGKTWYKFTPRPVETVPPILVKPNTKATWNYKNPSNLAISGIYTQEDLDKMRDRIMFPMENTAVLNQIAQKVSGNGTHYASPSMMNLFDENTLEKLAENAWDKSWGRFISFGTFSAGLIGIFMLIRCVKLMIDTIIHGYTLHTIYGWSIHLLGALWDSVTTLLVHLARSHESRTPKVEAEIESMETASAPLNQNTLIYPEINHIDETKTEGTTKKNFV